MLEPGCQERPGKRITLGRIMPKGRRARYSHARVSALRINRCRRGFMEVAAITHQVRILGMRVRTATNADAQRVREIVFTVLAEYGLTEDPGGVDSDLDDIEASYIRAGGVFEVVEAEDGRIVGTLGLHPEGNGVCELRKMYLLREARGRGIGRELMDRTLTHARRLGFRRIELETATPLVEAIALYKRYGFRPIRSDRLCSRCDQAYALDLEDQPTNGESQ